MEKFAKLEGFSRYDISSDGYVISHCRSVPKVMKVKITKSGYEEVQITSDEGVTQGFRVNRLVALTFMPEGYKEGLVVDHINGDKMDNRLENLRWCTVRENSGYHYSRGGKTVGVKPYKGKWRAIISFDKKDYHIGMFKTFEEALAARKDVEDNGLGVIVKYKPLGSIYKKGDRWVYQIRRKGINKSISTASKDEALCIQKDITLNGMEQLPKYLN